MCAWKQSSGNSIFVEAGNCKLLIDAGFSGIRITRALKEIDRSFRNRRDSNNT